MKCPDCGIEMVRLSKGFVCEQCANIRLDSDIQRGFVFKLPVKVYLRTRKRDNKDVNFRLNLNNYRNTNQFDLAKAKVKYAKDIQPLMEGCPVFKKIKIEYKLFVRVVKKEKRIDTNNILSIVDKFFCDSLVTNELIKDDDYHFLVSTTNEFGGFDYDCPDHYVIATVKEQI